MTKPTVSDIANATIGVVCERCSSVFTVGVGKFVRENPRYCIKCQLLREEFSLPSVAYAMSQDMGKVLFPQGG